MNARIVSQDTAVRRFAAVAWVAAGLFAFLALAGALPLGGAIGGDSARTPAPPGTSLAVPPGVALVPSQPVSPLTYAAYLVDSEAQRQHLLATLSPFPDAIQVLVVRNAEDEARIIQALEASEPHLRDNGYALRIVDLRSRP